MDKVTLLIESYWLIKKSLSKNGGFKVNKEIQKKVKYLNEMYGLEHEDIHSYLFDEFITKKLYLKYDPEKTKLSTFVAHCTNNNLWSLKRKYDSVDKNYREIPLDDDSGYRLSRKRGSISLSMLERCGVEAVIESNTPEDYYFAKELIDLMSNIYSENEILVLLGYKDRRSEAERLSMDYYAYCKRLSRKHEAFKLILQETGYL
jgi:hypothetical protein